MTAPHETGRHKNRHDSFWTNFIGDVEKISWLQVAQIVLQKSHAYSNYKYCKKRNYNQVREDVFLDERIRQYVNSNEGNKAKVDHILDEMCHLHQSQHNPTRKIKIAGIPFLRCITNIYSAIYVNNNLLPRSKNPIQFHPKGNKTADISLATNLFREQYLAMTRELPVVILPTHRSYMDFLFISYIMFSHELPLPIVAAGDNFKAMGKILCDYLKGTGAFLIRRNASNKKDIEASTYYDILRAYVHSIISGGENPLEFFMEGTRTRAGQVLHPKTGLLSMVVDMYLDKSIEDVYILPTSISYQRPMEEQLYVAENTPQIGIRKPKESAKNLLMAYETITKKKYGKVYVRLIEPFKLSEAFKEWKEASNVTETENGNKARALHEFTNYLANRVCLEQAYKNVLMPINLLACSALSRSFMHFLSMENTSDDQVNCVDTVFRIPIDELMTDFKLIEDTIEKTQPQFIPGWNGCMDLFDEFKIDRDDIIRADAKRRFVEFDINERTFHTLLYYCNQVTQMVLPLSIFFILLGRDTNSNKLSEDHLVSKYKQLRTLLATEFLMEEQYIPMEIEVAKTAIESNEFSPKIRAILVKPLIYVFQCKLVFLYYLKGIKVFDKKEFLRQRSEHISSADLFISKDTLRNMMVEAKSRGIGDIVPGELLDGSRGRPDERFLVKDCDRLDTFTKELELALSLSKQIIANC